MKVFVTGVGGIVGRNAVISLLETGHEVYALYRQTPLILPIGFPNQLSGRLHLVQGDLRRTEFFPSGIDVLVHAAATSPTPSASDDKIKSDNIDGTQALASWADKSGIAKVIYCSSLSIYGRPSVPVVCENTPFDAKDVYGYTKLVGEDVLRERCRKADVIALRLPGIIGVGAERNWLAKTTQSIMCNQDFSIFNPDSLFNNTLLAADLANFITSQLEPGPPGFDAVTLSSRKPVSLITVIRKIQTVSGNTLTPNIQKAPYPSFYVSIKRAQKKYSFAPSTTLNAVTRYVKMLKPHPK